MHLGGNHCWVPLSFENNNIINNNIDNNIDSNQFSHPSLHTWTEGKLAKINQFLCGIKFNLKNRGKVHNIKQIKGI